MQRIVWRARASSSMFSACFANHRTAVLAVDSVHVFMNHVEHYGASSAIIFAPVLVSRQRRPATINYS